MLKLTSRRRSPSTLMDAVDDFADFRDFGFSQGIGLLAQVDLCFRQNLLGGLTADAINISECHFHPLVAWEVTPAIRAT